MGADFIFNYVALKYGLTEKQRVCRMLKAIDNFEIPELSNNIKDKIISSLEEKKSKNFAEFCEFWEGLYNESVDECPTEDEAPLTEKQAKQHMKDIVNEFFGNFNNREIGEFNFKGYRILLTGGMSWGDNPTECLSTFEKFNYLPTNILIAGGIE